MAALELARRAGDEAAVKRHQARLAKIRKSFMEKLWIPSKGYVGSYVEQGGHERLHEDCWLYAIFCPIDAGLLDASQAAQSLYYSEWGLQREDMPYGGQRCWTSNWVPSLWSLREMWPGDNYHLALAYFQTGLADDGWTVLRGTFPHMAFYGPVPGNLGYPNGGTDFNDCAAMFCRGWWKGCSATGPIIPTAGSRSRRSCRPNGTMPRSRRPISRSTPAERNVASSWPAPRSSTCACPFGPRSSRP